MKMLNYFFLTFNIFVTKSIVFSINIMCSFIELKYYVLLFINGINCSLNQGFAHFLAAGSGTAPLLKASKAPEPLSFAPAFSNS